jgi:hypothetical protein
MLNGQKLQGTATAEEVNNFLVARKIAFEGVSPKEIVQDL